MSDTTEACKTFLKKEHTNFLVNTNTFSQREISLQANIMIERYSEINLINANLFSEIISQRIVPSLEGQLASFKNLSEISTLTKLPRCCKGET